jgi:thioesterase domain-containing protein/acyl carrier protein
MTGTLSTMIEVLTPIWQRVLQQSSIGVEENFFDLGGDSLTALELFNEIAHVYGRDLPPVMIYQAPTIAALATILTQPTTPPFPPLVLLKPGVEEPPVFITHGLGGSVIDFFQVVRHVQTGHSIYGMQARGINGVEEPFDRVEDMAEYSLDAIRKLQPRGPYLLVGYSFGGLVTLEMAQRLSENGEAIGLLAMLDAYPHIRHLSPGQRMRLTLQRLTRRAAKTIQMPERSTLSHGTRSAERRLPVSRAVYQPPSGMPLSPGMQHVYESAYAALERYHPHFYHGRIRFVRAEISTNFPDDPAAVWAKFANRIEVETVSGDHLGIMTTHFEKLASVLSRYLREACSHE